MSTMKNYNSKEIGMLLGAGIGGTISVVGFYIWSNTLFFISAVVGIALGVAIGSAVDRKSTGNGY